MPNCLLKMVLTRSKLIKYILLRRLLRKTRPKHRSCYIRQLFAGRTQGKGEKFIFDEIKYDPYYYKKCPRMSENMFQQLLAAVSPGLTKMRNHMDPIDPKTRLAISLRFLGTGMSQTSLAFAFRVSQQSVSQIFRETMNVIIEVLQPVYLPKPTLEQSKQIAKEFHRLWDFPNCCRAIDGKHVRTRAPSNSGSLYHNYKSFFSTVLFARVDAHYKFVDVDIGVPGSQSDGGILETSNIGRLSTNGCLPKPAIVGGFPRELPYVLIGDEGFGLKSWLMRPFAGQNLAPSEAIFNYRLSRARRVVENAFGILAARWRILHTSIQCCK